MLVLTAIIYNWNESWEGCNTCVTVALSEIAKEAWVRPLISQRLLKDKFQKLYEALYAYPPPPKYFALQYSISLWQHSSFHYFRLSWEHEETGGLDTNVDVERRNENTPVQLFGRSCPRRHVCLHLFCLPRRRSFRKENGAGCVFDSALVRPDSFTLTCSKQGG